MIPNTNPSVTAVYYPTPHREMRRAVLAWDEDEGVPLVISSRDTLVRASHAWPGFSHIDQAFGADQRLVQIMPATRGETVVWQPGEEDEETWPVIGWGLQADGEVVALDVDANGEVQALTSEYTGCFRIDVPRPTAEGKEQDQ